MAQVGMVPPSRFLYCSELQLLLEELGLEVIEFVGLEGIGSLRDEKVNNLKSMGDDVWELWWETHLQQCTDPAVVEYSEHFLAICKI